MAVWIYTYSELSLIFSFIDIADYFDPSLFIPGNGMLPLPNVCLWLVIVGRFFSKALEGGNSILKINLSPALNDTGTTKMSPGFSF